MSDERELSDTEKLMKREMELAEYAGEFEVLPASMLRREYELSQKPEMVLKSYLPTMDTLIDGFALGEITVITGPTKGGKTLLGRTLTEAFLRQKHDTLWFPYEAGKLRFIRGFGAACPEFLMPKNLKRSALDWLRERIWESQLKYNHVHAVFIDHLHFLFDMAQSRNPSLEIGVIMRLLVGMAQEFNVALFLIAHMKKVGSDKDGKYKEPGAGDTRDSGMIECECDNTLAVWRSREKGSVKSKIKIIHNRRNGVMDEVFLVEKVGPYLREVETHQQEPPQTWENKY
jgi:hypothetical protein